MCDQLRADAVGFAPNAHVHTPNLDRLAHRGVIFDNMYCQSSVCVPSRSCMITGKYMSALGQSNGSTVLDPRHTTLPEHLQTAGYRTGLFGKLHLTPQQYTERELDSSRPIDDAGPFLEPSGMHAIADAPGKDHYGFQHCVEYEDILLGNYVDWLRERDPALAERMPERRTGGAAGRSPWRPLFPDTPLRDAAPLDVPSDLHPSMFVGDRAADYFAQHHNDAPLFMHVSFVDPHHPFDPPEELAQKYPPERMPGPKYTDTGEVTWPPTVAARTPDFTGVTDHMTRTTIGLYYAMMEQVDRAVGHLVGRIEAAGELDNTVFVFVSDHGELLGDYGLWRKGGYHYDSLIRIPSFISYPAGLPQDVRIDELVESIDLMPTLLGLLGVSPPDGVQGRDLSAALRNGDSVGKDYIYCEIYTTWWGPFVGCWTVRTPDAKLNYFPDDRTAHLFDLKADPDERRDVYHAPEYRSLRDQMTGHLLDAIHHQTDPLPRVLSQF